MPYPWGFPGGSVVKENPPANTGDAEDAGSIPGSGRSPGWGNGNPLQYSCLENPKDRGAWQTTVHGVAQSWTRLRMHTHEGAISKQKLLERFYGSFFFFFFLLSLYPLPWKRHSKMAALWSGSNNGENMWIRITIKVSTNRNTENKQRLCNTSKKENLVMFKTLKFGSHFYHTIT